MIDLKNITKEYNDQLVIDNVSVSFNEAETTVILGPSGAGKSTLLRAINLLELPDSGEMELDEYNVNFDNEISDNQKLMIRKKSAMVFQNWNLFPHLTVLQNIVEGPIQVLHVNAQEANERAMELLKKVGLTQEFSKYPYELSGGQQQRVSICRALAMDPKYILFDEPTSALDPEFGAQILRFINQLAEQSKSQIIITHNIEFARKTADKIIFLEGGKIHYNGPADEFFNKPSKRVEKFLKAMEF